MTALQYRVGNKIVNTLLDAKTLSRDKGTEYKRIFTECPSIDDLKQFIAKNYQ